MQTCAEELARDVFNIRHGLKSYTETGEEKLRRDGRKLKQHPSVVCAEKYAVKIKEFLSKYPSEMNFSMYWKPNYDFAQEVTKMLSSETVKVTHIPETSRLLVVIVDVAHEPFNKPSSKSSDKPSSKPSQEYYQSILTALKELTTSNQNIATEISRLTAVVADLKPAKLTPHGKPL